MCTLPGLNRLRKLALATAALFLTAPAPAQGGNPDVIVEQQLILSGVTLLKGNNHICVGQQITATAIGGPVPAPFPSPPPAGWSFSWSVAGGAPFTSYAISNASGKYVGFTSPTVTGSSSISFYFAQPGSATISCSVTYPGGGFDVAATVTVDGPTFNPNVGYNIGLPQFFSTPPMGFAYAPPFNGVALWGAGIVPLSAQGGIIWCPVVTTPSTPNYGTGAGWCFTQLLTANQYYIDTSGTKHTAYYFTVGGTPPAGTPIWPTCLDLETPYQGNIFTSGQAGLYFDAPYLFFDAEGGPIVAYEPSFQTYIMYTPPGAASMPVPIEVMGWGVNAVVDYIGDGFWNWQDQGVLPPALSSYPTPFPQWSYCMGQGQKYWYTTAQ